MKSDLAIRVENLSKRYRIGMKEEMHSTLVGAVTDFVRRPLKNMRRLRSLTHFAADDPNVIWALKDINFEVRQGEVVGIIGRNGAGKSTLLKVLSKITYPTSGRVWLQGRVSSLLEVGTGFHPELTGRENVYLNGTILGMTRVEIDQKFDEIVDFSGVEKFMDTPVKFYSSGMRVRLAFSVAAHLEPEILLVDEVLAVGDTEFQKKSIGKMESVSQSGRTVLFVSHNLASVQSLCSRGIVLNDGEVHFSGDSITALQEYLNLSGHDVGDEDLFARDDRTGGDKLRFSGVEFLDAKTLSGTKTLISGQPVIIRLHYKKKFMGEIPETTFGIGFFTLGNQFLFSCRSDTIGRTYHLNTSSGWVDCKVDKWPLSQGRYSFNLISTSKSDTLDWIKSAGYIDVESGDFYGTGKLPGGAYQGVFVNFEWN